MNIQAIPFLLEKEGHDSLKEKESFFPSELWKGSPNKEQEARESLFHNHHLQVSSLQGKPIEREASTLWVFLILMCLTFMMVRIYKKVKYKSSAFWMFIFSVRYVMSSFVMTLGKGYAKLSILFSYTVFIALFLYWLLLTYQPISYVGGGHSPLFLFTLILLSFSVLVLIKMGIILFFGSIFQAHEITRVYLFNEMNFNFFMVFLGTPLLFLLFFSSSYLQYPFFITLIVLLVTVFVMRLLMSLRLVLFHSKFSKPYLFYYLCIIEFVPILVVIKYLIPVQ